MPQGLRFARLCPIAGVISGLRLAVSDTMPLSCRVSALHRLLQFQPQISIILTRAKFHEPCQLAAFRLFTVGIKPLQGEIWLASDRTRLQTRKFQA